MSHKTAQPISERSNIIFKAVMHELALHLEDDSVITIAQAAGTDKTAVRLARELQARKIERAEQQPSA